MRTCVVWCGFMLLAPFAPVVADDAPKLVQDVWEIAYLDGNKAGYVHTTVRARNESGRGLFLSNQELNLTVKRFNDTVSLRMETGTEEDERGVVTAVSMKQVLGKEQQVLMQGTVEGKRLHVVVDELRLGRKERKLDKNIPWNEAVIGLYKQQRMFQQRKVKPGDSFSYQSFEPTISYVVTTQVRVADFEEIDIQGKKRRLLRVDAEPEKLSVQNTSVQLPPLRIWLDENFEPLRSDFEMPGLGKLSLYRGSAEAAHRSTGRIAEIKDIGLSQLIPLNRRIPNAYDATNVVYRIRLKGDEDSKSAFAVDDRQQIKNLRGDVFELQVRAQRESKSIVEDKRPGDEYLKSCYFINSDNALVKELGAKAVGRENDSRKKALLIERWVKNNMKNTNFSVAFATADEVARTLEGDCTEHAVLAAAMCRAVGIPSRTAFGLIYIDRARPSMGFHMWTEVWVRGQWLPIDATLGRGFVGASHLKIADHSWHDTQVLTPLLPVVRVVGKVGIEVVRVNGSD